MDKTFYIYQHVTLDTNEIFYIGKGRDTTKKYSRAHNKSKRSVLWKRTVDKYGYRVEIIKENITEPEAFELEIKLISEIGRRDLNKGTLVNFTNGGEGISGFRVSEETRKKHSNARKGVKKTPEHKKAIGLSNKGKNTGRKGMKWSPEQIQHLVLSNTGANNPMYNKAPWNKEKKHSEETIKKIKEKALGRKRSLESKLKQSQTLGGKSFSVYKDDILVGVWKIQRQCSRDLGISQRTIHNCLYGYCKTNKYGFNFKFLEEESNLEKLSER